MDFSDFTLIGEVKLDSIVLDYDSNIVSVGPSPDSIRHRQLLSKSLPQTDDCSSICGISDCGSMNSDSDCSHVDLDSVDSDLIDATCDAESFPDSILAQYANLGSKNEEWAQQYDLPLGVVFPIGFEGLSELEKDRKVSMYKNTIHLISLQLGETAMDVRFLEVQTILPVDMDAKGERQAARVERLSVLMCEAEARNGAKTQRSAAVEGRKRIQAGISPLVDEGGVFRSNPVRRNGCDKGVWKRVNRGDLPPTPPAASASLRKRALDSEDVAPDFFKLEDDAATKAYLSAPWWRQTATKKKSVGMLPYIFNPAMFPLAEERYLIPERLKHELMPHINAIRCGQDSKRMKDFQSKWGQDAYAYVYYQSGPGSINRDRGFNCAITPVDADGRKYTTCCVEETATAAMIAQAGLLDHRLRTRMSVANWLEYIIASPANLDAWLAEIGDLKLSLHTKRANGGKPPSASWRESVGSSVNKNKVSDSVNEDPPVFDGGLCCILPESAYESTETTPTNTHEACPEERDTEVGILVMQAEGDVDTLLSMGVEFKELDKHMETLKCRYTAQQLEMYRM